MTQYPVSVQLAAPVNSSNQFPLASDLPGGFALNYAGNGNVFPCYGSFPVDTSQAQLGSLYLVSSINFKARIQVDNPLGSGSPTGTVSPSGLVLAASFTTDDNGVVAAAPNMSLNDWSFINTFPGAISIYDFQQIVLLPTPTLVSLLSEPTLNLVAGIQLPAPCLPSTDTPGASTKTPYMVNGAISGAYVYTAIQLSGITVKAA